MPGKTIRHLVQRAGETHSFHDELQCMPQTTSVLPQSSRYSFGPMRIELQTWLRHPHSEFPFSNGAEVSDYPRKLSTLSRCDEPLRTSGKNATDAAKPAGRTPDRPVLLRSMRTTEPSPCNSNGRVSLRNRGMIAVISMCTPTGGHCFEIIMTPLLLISRIVPELARTRPFRDGHQKLTAAASRYRFASRSSRKGIQRASRPKFSHPVLRKGNPVTCSSVGELRRGCKGRNLPNQSRDDNLRNCPNLGAVA
jgi:hypothetical protein